MRNFWEIFRFEVGYQLRRYSTWFYFLLLFVVTFLMAREVFIDEAKVGGYFLNAPFALALVTLVACILGLLPLAAIAGGAAARDVETRMHPLFFTAPIGKAAYLGGRFFAAFTLGALMMGAITVGLLGAALLPGEHGDLIGPLRPAAYLYAYFLLALPNAFLAMALMFSAAAFGRRGVVSYLGATFIFFTAVLSWQLLAVERGHWELAKLTDPMGLTLIGELSRIWTSTQKNTLLVGPQPPFLINRFLWFGLALGILALTYFRFKFAHLTDNSRKSRSAKGKTKTSELPISKVKAKGSPTAFPKVRQAFGPRGTALQVLAVARESFKFIAKGWGGIALAGLALFVMLLGPLWFSDYYGVPELPTTGQLVGILENTRDHGIWLVIPLLIVYYTGELVWREREAGLGEIAGAAPVPVWVSLVGKFLGLAFALLAMQVLLAVTAMLLQARLGYYTFEVGLYAQILLGLRLTDFLLFALLSFFLQVVVDQKYIAHLLAVIAYVMVAFGPELGISPGPLVYGSDPGWSYSDIRGLEPYFNPWLLFKLYWAAWAVLLAILAMLLWPRGTERGFKRRLQVARHRFTRRTALVAVMSGIFIVALGGLIFYNTSLYAKQATPPGEEWRAEYERKYGSYAGIPQPRLTATNLQVEIYPERQAVEIDGTYYLVNKSKVPLDSIHVATALGAETLSLDFNLKARPEVIDDKLGHRMFVLENPLLPGDSLRLGFKVQFDLEGFPNYGMDATVVRNGTYFGDWWLPRIGYQRGREFYDAGQRQSHGLSPRPEIPPHTDSIALKDLAGQERVMLETVVGTAEGQTAVAPGSLRSTWLQKGRRYFRYSTDAPIRNKFAFFSAAYAVHEVQWKPAANEGQAVSIQILHHPGHTKNVERMARAVLASLDFLTRQLGPYPHRQIRFVEVPGKSKTLFAYPTNVSYQEGFAVLDPDKDPRGVDIPFATVAHEVAHHRWGHQLAPAQVGGAALLTEGLAWYSALEVVEAAHGQEHFAKIQDMLRQDYLSPRSRASASLLHSIDRVQYYRKGPLAMFALRAYIGKAQVSSALRSLLQHHSPGTTPLPTPPDLYRELQAVTPDSLQYLVHDLFAANTFWELETKKVTARQTKTGTWQVSLNVQARKVTIDETGVETIVPMQDWIEIGVYAPATTKGLASEKPLYLQKHRIRAGAQTITVAVRHKPAFAGVDPHHLLFDLNPVNNLKGVLPEQ